MICTNLIFSVAYTKDQHFIHISAYYLIQFSLSLLPNIVVLTHFRTRDESFNVVWSVWVTWQITWKQR